MISKRKRSAFLQLAVNNEHAGMTLLFKSRLAKNLNAEAGTLCAEVENLCAAQIPTPVELLRKNTPLFCARIAFAFLLIAGSTSCMLSGNPLLFTLGLIAQGAMYVHLIELQHSVLHLHAFESHRVNRLIGVLLGIPMLISFSDFQYRHLRHHKHLGTELNSETFSYQHNKLNSLPRFISAMLDYSRARTIIIRICKAFSNAALNDGQNPLMESRIKNEYRLFALLLACATLASICLHSFAPLLIWLAPLIAAEPIHFLLELPEHFALKAHSNKNVFENTRIWSGSWFARWYSHNTNYHLVHHFNQLVPMHRLPQLYELIKGNIPESSVNRSYPHFYYEVITGKLDAANGD